MVKEMYVVKEVYLLSRVVVKLECNLKLLILLFLNSSFCDSVSMKGPQL